MREQCGIMPRFTRCGQGRGRGEERVRVSREAGPFGSGRGAEEAEGLRD